ncbi:hypothetical protein C489_02092 [Natrinema versiforme JCM 10478]|uniref:Uncharacterized protein n=1 Tax=Natrinema versiforme JCM 10478 TaxID=1227496 RepID=L9YAE5_9EURY|nr:hypothetical protein C489_02092 [Natrinema versiforme JCM 10478]
MIILVKYLFISIFIISPLFHPIFIDIFERPDTIGKILEISPDLTQVLKHAWKICSLKPSIWIIRRTTFIQGKRSNNIFNSYTVRYYFSIK